MTNPRVTHPSFPQGYIDHPTTLLKWEQVESWLVEAVNYWLCTVRPDGRPHAIPVWGVWVEGRLHFDGSLQTRHARNIARNPLVTVHLESGDRAVILDGTACDMTPARELSILIAKAYSAKYAALGYSPEPTAWDGGGLFEVTPRTVIAWSRFTKDPTRFVFSAE